MGPAKQSRGHSSELNVYGHVKFTGSTFDELFDHAETTPLNAEVKDISKGLPSVKGNLKKTLI